MAGDEIETRDVPCPNCYGRGIVGDEEYKRLDAIDLEKMSQEIMRIRSSNADLFTKQYLERLCRMLHGMYEVPVRVYDADDYQQ